ncbi:hypothetical protein EG328_011741 [Venturia inaequalis]|uniref:Uncharacterized protein n=1 Tax=Venturia inaequalis TaxID=5025 RepID=A0A8H3UF29_VENIN|nr:hypothetical protein EG328_011741 [Venturia inaequalis]KAE9969391.1 hypothetical protein EG327_010655 [Venturia inaequalis]
MPHGVSITQPASPPKHLLQVDLRQGGSCLLPNGRGKRADLNLGETPQAVAVDRVWEEYREEKNSRVATDGAGFACRYQTSIPLVSVDRWGNTSNSSSPAAGDDASHGPAPRFERISSA